MQGGGFPPLLKLKELPLMLWDVPLSTYVSVGRASTPTLPRVQRTSLEAQRLATSSFSSLRPLSGKQRESGETFAALPASLPARLARA